VLASYGLLLVMTGDLAGSQRFGEVGLLLTERPEFREARPETLFMYLNFIRHWRHPIRDALGQLRDAVAEALDHGDQEYAGFLVATLLSQSFCVGRPLAEIDALAQSLIPQIRSQPVPSALCQAMQQLCLNLMGRSEDPFLIAGESGYDEREVLPAALREGDEVALSVAADVKLGLHFWSGDYAGAVRVAIDPLPKHQRCGGHRGRAHRPPDQRRPGQMQVAPGDRATAFRAPGHGAASWWAAGAQLRGTVCAARGCVGGERAGSTARRAVSRPGHGSRRASFLIGALAHGRPPPTCAQTGRTTLSEQMLRSRTSVG
jgi:hypothetical protein